MIFSVKFIHYMLVGFTFIGIGLCLIPVTLAWNFPFPTSSMSSDNPLPVMVAIKSIDYKITLVSSMSLSVHMIVDFFGHALVTPEDFFSYRDSLSNLNLLISLLIPDMIQFFYVIPNVDFVMFHCVQYIRFILITCCTLGYLSTFGGKLWQSDLAIGSCLLILCGTILRFYSCYFTGTDLIIFDIISMSAYVLATFEIFFLLKKWCSKIFRHNFSFQKSLITFDQYYCNIYLVASIITFSGLWMLMIAYKLPSWYQYDTLFLVSESMIFSVFYVIVTVFQGRAAVREAAISKVSFIIISNYAQATVTNVVM